MDDYIQKQSNWIVLLKNILYYNLLLDDILHWLQFWVIMLLS